MFNSFCLSVICLFVSLFIRLNLSVYSSQSVWFLCLNLSVYTFLICLFIRLQSVCLFVFNLSIIFNLSVYSSLICLFIRVQSVCLSAIVCLKLFCLGVCFLSVFWMFIWFLTRSVCFLNLCVYWLVVFLQSIFRYKEFIFKTSFNCVCEQVSFIVKSLKKSLIDSIFKSED